jgi:ATP-binding protein involved in chromosome partitioning
LGQVPLDPRIAESNDLGEPFFLKYLESPASKEFLKIADKVINVVEGKSNSSA